MQQSNNMGSLRRTLAIGVCLAWLAGVAFAAPLEAPTKLLAKPALLPASAASAPVAPAAKPAPAALGVTPALPRLAVPPPPAASPPPPPPPPPPPAPAPAPAPMLQNPGGKGVLVAPASLPAGRTPPSVVSNLLMPVRIDSFVPTRWSAGTSKKFTVSGVGFGRKPEIKVKFTGASGQPDQAASITARTDTALDVLIPAGARSGRFVVESGAGADLIAVTSPANFVVPAAIEVTGVTPTQTTRGGRVTVQGRNFKQWDKIEVRFAARVTNTTNPADYLPALASNVTDTSFDVVVAPAAVTGLLQVIATLQGTGGVTDATSSFVQTSFNLTVNEPFVISSITPNTQRRKTAPVAGALVAPADPAVTLVGQGFNKQPDLAIYFTGDSGAQDQLGRIWNKRDTEVMVLLPEGARTGKVKAVLGTGAATETQLSANTLTLFGPVEVMSIAPMSARRGDSVVITGKGFLNRKSLSVTFNNGGGTVNQTSTVVSSSDTQIEVKVPPLAGSGNFSVTVGTGMEFETVTSATGFTVLPPVLAITDVSPTTGSPGNVVRITGYGLNSPVVNFTNGVRATVNRVSQGNLTDKGYPSVLEVVVPQGAVTGPISVITAEGTVNSLPFSVPTYRTAFTDFQPSSATVGATLTLTGSFDTNPANMTVKFNAWGSAQVVTQPFASTGQTLQVRVPTGARTGSLAVSSVAGDAGPNKFLYLPPVVTGFSVAAAPVGYEIDIQGDNFGPDVTAVSFNGVRATTVSGLSIGAIRVTVPSGAVSGPVTVQTPGGTATSPMAFTVR